MKLTVRDVARLLQRSPSAVYKMIQQQRDVGERFVYTRGRGWLLDEKDLVQKRAGGSSND